MKIKDSPLVPALIVVGVILIVWWLWPTSGSAPNGADATVTAPVVDEKPVKSPARPSAGPVLSKPTTQPGATSQKPVDADGDRETQIAATATSSAPVYADVVAAEAVLKDGAFEFSITISSRDLGCDQYANWWEIVSEKGDLLYRRVLAHSHVSEQPFTRASGAVRVSPDTPVWIRAHMHPYGYGGRTLKGTIRTGFRPATPAPGFAASLRRKSPLPEGCAF